MNDYISILKRIRAVLEEDRFRDVNGVKVSFFEYSQLRDFQRENRGDEDIVVTPILVEILKILDYRSGVNLLQQDVKDGDKPDFRTLETNKFILDAKSTGVPLTAKRDSKSAINQIARYLSTFKGYEYGILFNLQRFEFFQRINVLDKIKTKHLADRTINLVKLLINFDEDRLNETNDFENFKWFYDQFKFQHINPEDYVEIIKNRKTEDLIIPDKKYLKKLVYGLALRIQNNIKGQLSPMLNDLEYHIHLKYELDKILQEINPESGENAYGIAAEELVKQISYVILLRFILIRIFEDNELISVNLYDGGFKKKLDPPFSFTLKEILRDARVEAGELFTYFEDKFPYNFQITKDKDLLINILYELSKINFAEINFDLIGDLYEHYLNEDERKDKGQYYTPHYIVEFILDRVGFVNAPKVEILSKTLLDPACGSGSFLVEAAIRMRNAGLNREVEAKRSIANNLHGSELTAFASRLAELNLVIQVLTLIKRIDNEDERQTQSFRVCTTDSLMRIFNHNEFTGSGNLTYDTSGFTSTYKDVFVNLIAGKNDFDYVVGNPPYVGEKGHKELFRPLQNHPYWRNHYLGKSDYLYYFIILGLSKLREGGKLGFITTQYWLTADGGGKLRKYILENAKIVEIIDFKGIKLFPEAQGQENIVFVLQKCSVDNERANNKIKIIEFRSEWVNNAEKYTDSDNRVVTNYDRWIELLTNKNQFDLFADPERNNFTLGKDTRHDLADVYYSGITQGELDENAWYLYSKERPIELTGNFAFLTELFNVNQGIVSGADKVTAANIKSIPFHDRVQHDIKIGDPIFVFDQEQLNRLNLSDEEQKFVRPFYKNSDIRKGHVNANRMQYVIFSNDITDIDDLTGIHMHFNRLKALLQSRLTRYEEDYRWFNLHRGRDKTLFESEKLVTSRRAKENTFAYENMGTYPQSDITLITPKPETRESLKYLFTLLNSSYLNDWYGRNTKKKGNMREYYFTPLSKVPIRKIDFDNADEVMIHDILGGIYSTNPVGEDGDFSYEKITRTYIRQKGLADNYIALKNELYELVEAGYIFDPETELTEKNGIRMNKIELANYLFSKGIADIKFVRDSLLFYPKLVSDPTLYSFNATERKEVEELIGNCIYFIKSKTKDFVIKGVDNSSMLSLFAEPGDIGSFNFECSFDLITKDNKVIQVESKSKEDANWLVEMIQFLLRKEKTITWETLLTIPVRNQEMETIIKDKRDWIFDALKPIESKVKSRLDEIFQNREIEPLEKIKNIHYLQYLIDRYVSYLYSGD
jgi:type I restriction-modification system DNA methylase subunit